MTELLRRYLRKRLRDQLRSVKPRGSREVGDELASTWIETNTSGVYTMGSSPAIQQPVLMIPAGKRLVRAHYYPRFRATVLSVGASPGANLAPQYHHQFKLNSVEYTDRIIHEHYDVMEQQPTAFWDTQAATRVFMLYMQLRPRDAGFELKTSYGGPGHGAITLSGSTTFTPLGGTANFSVVYDNTLRALYES